MKHTIGCDTKNIVIDDIKAKSTKIISINTLKNAIELNLNSQLTSAEYNDIVAYINIKNSNPKVEYAALLLDSEKINYIAERLGLK